MKKILTPIALLLALTSNFKGSAQSWNIGGNNVPNNPKFGTTNNKPVLFISNNTEKMRLTPVGNLNFKTSSQSIQFANPSGIINPMMLMFSSGSGNPDRMVIAHSPSFPDWGLRSEEHTSELQSHVNLVCRLLLEK